MFRYIIILQEPNADAWQQVKDVWDHHYIVSETMAMIAVDKSVLAREITDALGMDMTAGCAGFVLEYTWWYGYWDRDLMRWMNKTI